MGAAGAWAGGLCGGGCCAGCCAVSAIDKGAQEMSDIITRRRRLKSFIGTYLSTLRAYNDGDSLQIGCQLAKPLFYRILGRLDNERVALHCEPRSHLYDGSQAGTAERMKSTIASSEAPG